MSAPKLTLADIEATIVGGEYHRVGDTYTSCYLTLRNGCIVHGESACASPENFNAEVGRQLARKDAVEKIWPLEGYLLRQRLWEAMQPGTAIPPADPEATS